LHFFFAAALALKRRWCFLHFLFRVFWPDEEGGAEPAPLSWTVGPPGPVLSSP
jgi:hypothetical protein